MLRNTKSCFVTLFLISHEVFCLTTYRKTDEHVLFNILMANYNKATRPVLNASDAVNVKFDVSLVQIIGLDAENQVLNTHMWVHQRWIDECLHWNPDDFNGMRELRIPSDAIWLPDVELYNSADDYKRDSSQNNVIVNFDGTVFWHQSLRLRSSCAMYIQYFPFDVQHCVLKFASWSFDGSQMNLTLSIYGVDDLSKDYFNNTEWHLQTFKAKRNIIKYACCPEVYIDVSVQISIQRMSLYYFNNIIIPCVWLTILNLLVFFLPPDSGDKISLGVTIFLAFSVFMLVIAEKVPVTSQSVPLIGVYLTVSMGMTSLSLIMTVFILNLNYVGPHRKGVPRWLQILTYNILARILYFKPTTDPFQRHDKKHSTEHTDNKTADDKQTDDSIAVRVDTSADKQMTQESRQDIVEEWRFVASVLDRMLFWFFLTAIVIYSVLILYPPGGYE